MTITIELPLPPSANHAYFNVPGKGRRPSAKHAEWKREAGWLIKLARLTPLPTGRYSFSLLLPAMMYGDVDNRVKLVLDLLGPRGMRVTPDDKFARIDLVDRSGDVPSGRCIVSVSSVGVNSNL